VPNAAQAGGQALARFDNGIAAAHLVFADQKAPSLHLTLLGHSYGSTTVGYSLQGPNPVNDVVVFGSPGQGPANLQVPPGHYHVEWNRDDGVPLTHETLGPSPYNPSNQWLSTDAVGPLTATHGHSTYLDPGSTSQHNMAAVITNQHVIPAPSSEQMQTPLTAATTDIGAISIAGKAVETGIITGAATAVAGPFGLPAGLIISGILLS
jgi:pimeloyl-ACP methyl ester carboxylesterase